MIESTLLLYTLYTEILRKEGFKLNPYDRCVTNKIINGKQCTIRWYINDNILSHVKISVVTSVFDKIEGYFPILVVARGKDLNFLGMEIGFLGKGKLKLGLVQYICSILEELEDATW